MVNALVLTLLYFSVWGDSRGLATDLTLIFIPMELEYNTEKEAENWEANLR